MGKILVLAEKPSVGRELARVLGSSQRKEGYIDGPKYTVTWALGHLVTLADPEKYGEQYKKWELETLPMLPKKMELVVIGQTSKQYSVVKNLLKTADSLVIATDAGREGELVARWILAKAGFKKPIKRLWISSQTDKAIKEGFANLKDGRDYENLYHSAQCRAEADWVVGINVTRALTCKYNAQLSAGRVQTPTLAMICDREREIKAFVPKDFFGVSIQTDGFKLTWGDKKTHNTRIADKATAESVLKKLQGGKVSIITLKKEHKREPAPLLYDLTELQRDANRKYSYTAKETLNHMQKLYEVHKLLTYPRTDSRYISQDIVATLTERLRAISIGNYAPFAKNILKNGVRPSKRFVDDTKVSDHHAIIPTEQYVDMSALSAEERRVYDLVVKRFLAVLGDDFIYESLKISADVNGESFSATGKTILDKGWKKVYDGAEIIDDDDEPEAEEKSQVLPPLQQGLKLPLLAAKITTGKTKPPARYNEATLLSAMEHPGKFVESRELRTVLDDARGIGTPATRADIIEKLFLSSYVERRGKDIFPLSKGMQLVEIVPQDLKSAELTAKWEQQLTLISRGALQATKFNREMQEYATTLVQNVKMSSTEYHHDNATRNRCPLCDKFLLEINGKRGKMHVCPDRECGYRQNLSQTSNARCPKCRKNLEVVGDGEKKIYTCKCGFREKFERFNEYLKENSSASKAQVQKFMQSQKASVPEVSPFAEALARAMEKKK